EIAQYVLVDAHRALELGDRSAGAVDIEHDVVALAVLLDAIGEVAQAPVLAADHLALVLLRYLGKGIRQSFRLRRGDVLARNEDSLVEGHDLSISLWMFTARSRPALRIWPPGPSRDPPGKEAAHYTRGLFGRKRLTRVPAVPTFASSAAAALAQNE